MQASAHYYADHEAPGARYESYDGSQYSVEQSFGGRMSDVMNGHGPGAHGYGGGDDDDDDDNDYRLGMPPAERASQQQQRMSLNTRLRAPLALPDDAVGQHLLFETAMVDSQPFAILSMDEVDALKKEHARLGARLEATKRKLALETKVKDAAQNLQRLYSVKGRPDTPQSPESTKLGRGSLLGHRARTSSQSSADGTLHQAGDEFATSTKKVDELNETIKALLDRRQQVERQLLGHTAAVLADQSARVSQQISGTALTNGHRVTNDHEDADEDDEDGDATRTYSPDEFDTIRDILHSGAAISGSKLSKNGHVRQMQQDHEQQMASVQNRLEQLNDQLRLVIGEASRSLGKDPEPELDLHDEDDDQSLRLDRRFSRLESNLRALEQEQANANAQFQQLRDGAGRTGDVEQQLEHLNHQLHDALLGGANASNRQTLREVPPVSGHGYEPQLQYLAESLAATEQLLQQNQAHAQTFAEYEATLGGLWQILQSDADAGPRSPGSPSSPLKEDFSLHAFSAHVQHIFDRAQSAKEQQDILLRQIQQQRELNGKSDTEKEGQLTELQTQHAQLVQEHGAVQEELARAMAQSAQSDSEASQTKLELMNVMNEFESLKRTIDARQQEHGDMSRELQDHRSHAASLQEQIESLEAQVAEAEAKEQEAQSAISAKEAAEKRQTEIQAEMQDLESEVVRLTTELTMAKAELEGAYGSRAERAREAQAAEVSNLKDQLAGLHSEHETLRGHHEATLAEVEDLKSKAANSDRTKELEKELQEMTNEFQELAKEAVELEKERGQLEDLIDGLRDRCDTLETQLNDEKIRWLGIRSPGGASDAGTAGGREMTSTMVLRQEFKKMMRETRAEGVKLLRAEQDQRRHVESELRRLRQANGPLGAKTNGVSA